ncbi:DNA-binding response regulator, OmpR family, contains REC and winged-helix (wHTH) domain [Epilithonimonas bovis DSM 19482]|uniref:DNA-binding response regulator, OmpR family, contains REC and winged-helix (WHTH) domain n=1 Tax=Epilithonimonas bovis DSM 19482 TaxID=1121284 RepID=A0A1U7Q098_9FLAO|nr:response regulator transcription factor [Epilithonimonas bovis]SIT97823.1 DNA-binding response regulator, OmpR family, contains REC and winged-helix (wHTH) domain [Epilithonimonas bovis DSM 19482]
MDVLLVEDDSRISDFLLKGLEEAGYTISLAKSGEEARSLLADFTFDIILMDIMLPGIDGAQLTQLIRYRNNSTPILVISALNSVDDKVKLLDMGADDYLPKPFHFGELLSRIRALIRRSGGLIRQDDDQLSFGSITVDTSLYQVQQNGKDIVLSPTEYKLLVYLLKNKNKVLSRSQILSSVWGINFDSNTNVVDVYISYLRNKLDESGDQVIHTIKGVGYLIKD